MNKTFQTIAAIQKIQTLVDGGNKVTMITPELNSEEMAILFSFSNKEGWFLFKDNKFEDKELPDLPDFKPEFKTDKTPGQRLRAVIYVLWEQNGQQGDYDSFYKKTVEKFIEMVKTKLD